MCALPILGWVEEVERLLRSGLSPTCPAFQAIGYREVARHLDGEWPLEEAVEIIVRRSRHYAKRQMTWFRRMPDVVWIDQLGLDDRIASIERVCAGDRLG